MKVGIPRGLLYCRYNKFIETFFSELGAEIITSPDTNKNILDLGIKYCVDEACLPMKVFHGHTACLKDKCDIIFIPRIMQLYKDEYICPKFCGLTEMIKNDIPGLPPVTSYPIYGWNRSHMEKWAKATGGLFTKNNFKIKKALALAIAANINTTGIENQDKFTYKAALAGHPYNIHDPFVNMNLIKKLNKLDIGVFTEESADPADINNEIKIFYKRPFWTFARNSYGFTSNLARNKRINGIIYVSSFGCGADSIIVELIKNRLPDFPFLLLKIDEQTGEAGLDTRIEAFKDMLERR